MTRCVNSMQDLIEKILTPAIQTWTPEQKREFRPAVIAQIEVRRADRRFLKSVEIWPDHIS